MSRREKVLWLSVGFAYVVGCLAFLPAYYEICEVAERTKQEVCASHQLVPFLALKLPQILDKFGGVLTALATIAIAWFTLSLKQATDRLWDAGERQLKLMADTSAAQSRAMQASIAVAQQSADAAQASAAASTAIEFPLVRTNWFGPELMATDKLIQPRPQHPYVGQVNDGWPTQFSVVDRIEFTNYGRTPAFAESIAFGVGVATSLPETPVYTTTLRCGPNTVIEARGHREIDTDFGFELTGEQIRAIQALESVLWFYGKLTFHDVMGRSHDTCFCWQWGRQNEADSMSYFFDAGNAPAMYARRT